MTTVVSLRTSQLRRNKSETPTAIGEFREDVLTYSSIVYEALRKRRDFYTSTPSEHSNARRKKGDDFAD